MNLRCKKVTEDLYWVSDQTWNPLEGSVGGCDRHHATHNLPGVRQVHHPGLSQLLDGLLSKLDELRPTKGH